MPIKGEEGFVRTDVPIKGEEGAVCSWAVILACGNKTGDTFQLSSDHIHVHIHVCTCTECSAYWLLYMYMYERLVFGDKKELLIQS